jgi:hypothetical protein
LRESVICANPEFDQRLTAKGAKDAKGQGIVTAEDAEDAEENQNKSVRVGISRSFLDCTELSMLNFLCVLRGR